jgi:O-antigen ligase
LSKVIAVWAAVGIVLTGATQLRLAGQPIGPGELLLVLWAAFVGFCLLRGVRFAYTDAFKVFLTFWLVAAVILSLGSLVAIHINQLADRSAGHDTLAFLFVALLTLLLGIRLGDGDEYYLTLARATLFAMSAAALVLLGVGLVTTHLGPLSLWYYGVRFQGWSENPNQLAIFMLPMPFLGWYLLQQTGSVARKLIYLLAIVVCAAAGVATGSDSLRVAWAGSLGAIITLLWYRAVFRGRSRFLYISHILLPLAAIVIAIGAGPEIVERAQQIAQALYEEQGQGDTRFTIWSHGIDAILRSPLVGLGPGAHSGFAGPFEGLEAHNSFIDWGTSTGLTGVLLLLWLSLWCVWRAVRAHAFALVGVAVAVIIASLFHYSLRQPIYWLLLLVVAALTEQRPGARSVPGTTLPDRASPPLTTPVEFPARAGRS